MRPTPKSDGQLYHHQLPSTALVPPRSIGRNADSAWRRRYHILPSCQFAPSAPGLLTADPSTITLPPHYSIHVGALLSLRKPLSPGAGPISHPPARPSCDSSIGLLAGDRRGPTAPSSEPRPRGRSPATVACEIAIVEHSFAIHRWRAGPRAEGKGATETPRREREPQRKTNTIISTGKTVNQPFQHQHSPRADESHRRWAPESRVGQSSPTSL